MSDQIDVNQLSNAIQQKVDLPAQKNQSDIDFVIASQLPTSSNNYTWYRLYKSGWVEQGGQLLNTSGSNGTVTFLVEMKDTSYYATIQAYNSGSYPLLITTFTTTSFSYTGNVGKNWWQVKGMSAQGGS